MAMLSWPQGPPNIQDAASNPQCLSTTVKVTFHPTGDTCPHPPPPTSASHFSPRRASHLWVPSGLPTKLTPLKREVPRENTVLRFSIWACGCTRAAGAKECVKENACTERQLVVQGRAPSTASLWLLLLHGAYWHGTSTVLVVARVSLKWSWRAPPLKDMARVRSPHLQALLLSPPHHSTHPTPLTTSSLLSEVSRPISPA